MPVAYNACYGGFSLSVDAVRRAREISGNPLWGGPCLDGDKLKSGGVVDQFRTFDLAHVEVPRHDSVLIQVIKEMGEAANGAFAALSIRELPAGTRYRIDEYDGMESVMTPDDYDWIILE